MTDDIETLRAQLLAAQAHIARLVEALSMPCDRWNKRQHEIVKEALSTPINLDALHEDRAKTLEEAAEIAYEFLDTPELSGLGYATFLSERLREEAATHRAKKEVK